MNIRQRFRIYPTKAQAQTLNNMFGGCRFIYNWCLEQQNKEYQINNKRLHKYELQNRITVLKKELLWLNDIYSHSLKEETEFLDKAYTNFFKYKQGFPKFKSKHNNHKSFTFPKGVRFKKNELFVPKITTPIKIKLHRPIQGRITRCTIIQVPSGKYYISVNQRIDKPIPIKTPIVESQAVGIDIGIKQFLTISDGTVISNPKFLKTSLNKLKKLSKKHSKKKKGSKNREKSRIRLARLHEKVSNQRHDFQNNVTKMLIDKYDTICLETLSAKNMLKHPTLAQSLSDISIGYFNLKLNYKAEWYGKNILRCGRFEPSSKMCTCGVINKNLTLKDRIWTCSSCNTTHDRDVLASNNIKKFCFVKENTVVTTEIYACGNMNEVVHSAQESV